MQSGGWRLSPKMDVLCCRPLDWPHKKLRAPRKSRCHGDSALTLICSLLGRIILPTHQAKPLIRQHTRLSKWQSASMTGGSVPRDLCGWTQHDSGLTLKPRTSQACQPRCLPYARHRHTTLCLSNSLPTSRGQWILTAKSWQTSTHSAGSSL